MSNTTKAALLIGGILLVGGVYYYFKNQSLRKRYHAIDLTTIKASQMDSIIANPTLE